jgi:hypothetical protein
LHIRTEGTFLVASRLTVVNFDFHSLIFPDFEQQHKAH